MLRAVLIYNHIRALKGLRSGSVVVNKYQKPPKPGLTKIGGGGGAEKCTGSPL